MRSTRRTLAAVCAVALLTAACVRADITLESLLKEMVDYDAVAQWPQARSISSAWTV